MQLKTLSLVSTRAPGLAENVVETNDVPNVCLGTCRLVIDLTARCDQQTNSDDTYRPCVCREQDGENCLTQCASCVKDNGRSDPDDNDVADLMDDCGWDFNQADVPYETATDTTSTSPTAQTTSATSSAVFTTTSGTVVVTTTSETVIQTTQNPDATDTVTDPAAQGAAPKATSGAGLPIAGVVLGLPALF